MMANMTETVAPIPLGIAAFETGAVGMLSSLGVPVDAASQTVRTRCATPT